MASSERGQLGSQSSSLRVINSPSVAKFSSIIALFPFISASILDWSVRSIRISI